MLSRTKGLRAGPEPLTLGVRPHRSFAHSLCSPMVDFLDANVLEAIFKGITPIAAGFAWLYYQLTFGRRSRLKDDLEILELGERLNLSTESLAVMRKRAEEQIVRTAGQRSRVRASDLIVGVGASGLAGLLWASSDIMATGWRLFWFVLLALIALGAFSNAVNTARVK